MTAIAPTVAINGIPDGKQRDTESLSLDISGGSYSRLTYSWTSNYGGTGQFDNATSATPTWTRPDTDRDRNVSIQCAVTAHDDNDNTQAVRTDTEPTTIFHLPNADAPSINVLYPPEDFEGTTYKLETEVGKTHAGTYDNLTYKWWVFHGETDTADDVLDDRTLPNPTWTRNRVGGRTLFQINCNLRAHGTNDKALNGTEEFTQSFVQPWVDDRPDADAPSLDYVQTTNTDPSTSDDPGWFNGMVEGLEGTKFWARIRINETHHGLFDALSAEFTLVGRDDVDEQIQTWTWTRPDGTTSGHHPTESTPFEFTRPMVNSDQQYKVTVFLTATGDDKEAERGTSEITDNDSGYGFTRNTPQAQAPSLLIQHKNLGETNYITGIPNLTENDFTNLRATINGGTYDEISYAWERVEFGAAAGTGTTDGFSQPTSADTMLTYPNVATHHQYDVICTVTVTGNGTSVEEGSTDTVTDRRFFWSNPLPDTDAPSIDIGSVPNGIAGQDVQIPVTLGRTNTGLYDLLSYQWFAYEQGHVGDPAHDRSGEVFSLTERGVESPIMHRINRTTSDKLWDIQVILSAVGTDNNANGGTSETTSTFHTIRVTPLPDARIPPAIIIEPIPDGLPGTSAHIELDFAAGTYDASLFEWGWIYNGVQTGFGTNSPYALFHRPDIPDGATAPIEITVVCSVTLMGSGHNARDGTIAMHTYSVTTTLLAPPPEPPTPVPPPTIMLITDENGVAREITEVVVSESNGRGHTLSEIVATSDNGTAIEIWRADGS